MRDELPISVIENEVRHAWRTGRYSSPLFGGAVRELDKQSPIKGIYVLEHQTANPDTAYCTGEPGKIWFFDGDHFESVDEPPEIEQHSAIHTPTPILSYCFNEARGEFVINWYSGGRAGRGLLCRLSSHGAHETLEPFGVGWQS